MTSSTISSTPASDWRKTLGKRAYELRRHPLLLVGGVILLVWILVGLFAPQIATHDILAQNVSNRLQPPSIDHFFGTDELGRDIFSRVMYGVRITVPAGFLVTLFSSFLGLLIGGAAGYLGGVWDEIIMRIAELFMAFPSIILAMAISAALGPDIRNAIIALVIIAWPPYARVVRSLVISIKIREFVESAHSVGAGHFYILFRTILPNCIAPAIVMATLDIGSTILTFAGLSFLGLGADPTSPEWGRMVSIAIDFFDQWWMWLFPGLAIASVVLAFNFIGDGLRDWLDPRMRK